MKTMLYKIFSFHPIHMMTQTVATASYLSQKGAFCSALYQIQIFIFSQSSWSHAGSREWNAIPNHAKTIILFFATTKPSSSVLNPPI